MKSSIAATVFLTVLATARNCTPNLAYCGSTLLDIGNYQAQIDQALYDSNQAVKNDGKSDLFQCIGGSNGVIQWLGSCFNGCANGGSGKSDYCK